MTIFLSATLPKQPAFIYATFPVGTTVTASPAVAGQLPETILASDECVGCGFGGASSGYLTINFPARVQANCFALVGAGLAGATVAVAGSNDNFGSSTTLLAATPCGADTVCWAEHDAGTYKSYRYVFAGLTSSAKIKHIAPAMLAPLPFLEDNVCLAPLQAEGEHLISYAGLFLGSVTQRVMRPFSLHWGDVTPVEEDLFAAVMNACVATAQGLFFIPDTGADDVYFGWIDKKYKYEPKMKNGMYTIPAIPFTSRAV